MKTIEQEAEEYLKANCKYDSLTGFYERVEPEDLIKFTQVKILQAQIDAYQDSLYYIENNDNYIRNKIELLQKQLKELE